MLDKHGFYGLINVTKKKSSGLTHDASVISPRAHPPLDLDEFEEFFVAAVERSLDPLFGLRKIHQGVTYLPSEVTMVPWHVRNVEKFHLQYKSINSWLVGFYIDFNT